VALLLAPSPSPLKSRAEEELTQIGLYPGPVTSSRSRGRDVVGGSLTVGPNGELMTFQTISLAVTPMTMQELWSTLRQTRAPRLWDGKPAPPGSTVIYWTPAIRFECGRCRRPLGLYRACQLNPPHGARREYGIVEDTAHRYLSGPPENWTGRADKGPEKRPRPRPRHMIDREVGGRPGRTTVYIQCYSPGCRDKEPFERNFRRVGKLLFDTKPTVFPLD